LPRISHREFLLKAGQAGLGLSLAPQLIAPAGCGSGSANTVTDASDGCDAIIIGGANAGIGLGGNAMFNGMLFQTNPSEIFA